MTDEITSRLGAVSGLGLVSSRAAQRYAGTDMTMREIGRELGIDYLLVGSVRWAGTGAGSRSVRITLELLRAQDERQLWSTTYDRVIDDIFEVQSDIAGQVVERLGVTLREGERSRLSAQPTDESRGLHALPEGPVLLEQAHGREHPDRARLLPAGGRPGPRLLPAPGPGSPMRGSFVAGTAAWRRARRSRRPSTPPCRALEFDSTLAEAHASLAHIHFEFDHDWDAAEREYRRAIELNPELRHRAPLVRGVPVGDGPARGGAAAGRRPPAALDPLSPIIQTWVGLRYYFARQVRERHRGISEGAGAGSRLRPRALAPRVGVRANRPLRGGRRGGRSGRWPSTGGTCSIWPLSVMPMPRRG